MKTNFLLVLIFGMMTANAQDSTATIQPSANAAHSKFFSFSPMSRDAGNVNGLAFGVGHYKNKYSSAQQINGVNLEINPAPVAGLMLGIIAFFHLPDVIKNLPARDTLPKTDNYLRINNWTTTPELQVNGLNLSTGCFFTTTSMNGLNVSLGNKFKNFNGLSITPLGTIADRQKGMSVGIFNANTQLTGATVGIYNQSHTLNGMQLGIYNLSNSNKGIQVGVVNSSKSRGFQLGLWNVNGKRKMPIVNW